MCSAAARPPGWSFGGAGAAQIAWSASTTVKSTTFDIDEALSMHKGIDLASLEVLEAMTGV